MITLFNYLLIINIFASGFVLFSSPFEFYVGYIFIISFLIMYILRYRNITINRNFLLILIVLTISSLVNVYLGKDTIFLMAKQVLGILITGTAYYLLVKINNYEVEKLFKIYLRIALIVAIIGIFQEFSFLIGFKYGYDYSYIMPKWYLARTTVGIIRVNSIFMEPSHFAISMAPAFFVSLLDIFKRGPLYLNMKWGSIIILSYILTLSGVACAVFLVSSLFLLLYIKNSKYALLALIIIPILLYTVYRYMPEIRMRADDSLRVAIGVKEAASVNLSTYTLASNAFVTYKSFIDRPLFGRGLGSHPISYDEFIRLGVSGGFWQKDYPVANREDAGSLFLRLFSETGLFGIIVFFYFIFRCILIKNSDNKNLQIISNAIFVLFLAQLLRQGHYFCGGLFFFLWLYYFVYKINNKPHEENYHYLCR